MKIINACTLLAKAKERPIGYVSPGGYKKTMDGWVKVPEGKQQVGVAEDGEQAEHAKKFVAMLHDIEGAKAGEWTSYIPAPSDASKLVAFLEAANLSSNVTSALRKYEKIPKAHEKILMHLYGVVVHIDEGLTKLIDGPGYRAVAPAVHEVSTASRLIEVLIQLRRALKKSLSPNELAELRFNSCAVLCDEQNLDEKENQQALTRSWTGDSAAAASLFLTDAASVLLRKGDQKYVYRSDRLKKLSVLLPKKKKAFLKLMVKTMHEQVQKQWSRVAAVVNEEGLRFEGVELVDDKGIWLFRGVAQQYSAKVANQLESWTANHSTAVKFGGSILREYVRKEDIVSCFVTDANLHRQKEWEFMVLRRHSKDEV